MKFFLLLFFLVIVFINNSIAQWQTIYQDSVNYQFNTVRFLNSDTGFVAGYYVANSGIANGIILRTKDGGATWDSTVVSELIICIYFVNDSFGFCGGDGGADYLTLDIGENWQQRGYSSTMSDHSSIYFINPTIGYRSTMQNWIQKTIDTGMTWQNVYNTSGGSFFPGSSRMVFTDTLTGYLAQSRLGQSRSISKTSDGGVTWIDLNIPQNFFPHSCFFFDSLSGFAVGRYGKISSTMDGGINWSVPNTISNYFLYDIAFVTDSIGYIIGGFNAYDTSSLRKGIIFKTINRGASWQVMDSSYFDGLTKLHFPCDSVGYAVGMNGIILKISNANSVYTNIELLQDMNTNFFTFPNPARNTLYVQNITDEKIYIISLSGEIILETELHSLNENVKLDISMLSPGIYFIKNGSMIRKLMVER